MSENDVEIEQNVEIEQASPNLVARIRQFGEAGKKQWEQVFVIARALKDEDLPRLRAKSTEALQRLKSEGLFPRAQARGNELLLKVIARVREGAQSLESSLKTEAPAQAA